MFDRQQDKGPAERHSSKPSIRWFTTELSKEFTIKSEVIGNRQGEVSQAQFLGRSIRRTADGYEYEGNTKHTKILLEEWGLEDCKPLSSPGCALEKANEVDKQAEEEKLAKKRR